MGVVSDTHGLLRPEVPPLLEGCDLVVHAGDVGDPAILHALRRIAPVRAVRGNVDGGVLADLPHTEAVEVAGHLLYVVHIPEDLDVDPGAAGVSVVIHGHTHRPRSERVDGVLFLNPGSAGPRRFSLPVSLALLRLGPGSVEAEVVELDV
ncbi:MAG: metallophosphoesterase family protein [Longimicrobiales bacterium]